MMPPVLFIAALAALSQPTAYSQIGATGEQSEATNGKFSVKMLVTDDLDGFWKAWEGPTPPNISTTSRITRVKPVFAMLVFAGCASGTDGKCKVSVTYSITAPDGSAYGDAIDAEAWSGPSAGQNLIAALSSFGFRLEPQDKLGAYRVTAKMTDEIAHESLTVNETVTAMDN